MLAKFDPENVTASRSVTLEMDRSVKNLDLSKSMDINIKSWLVARLQQFLHLILTYYPVSCLSGTRHFFLRMLREMKSVF